MEKYKCEKNVYGRQCGESFRSESQLKTHVSSFHKKYTVDKKPEPEKKQIFNVLSGKLVTQDPFKIEPRKIKSTDLCVYCGKNAYIIEERGKPICFGYWSTWGCFYTKNMIDHDRKWLKIPCRHRNTYDPRPFTKKERKKNIKYLMDLEEETWNATSVTPHKELEIWHDDKIRKEIRKLENMRIGPC